MDKTLQDLREHLTAATVNLDALIDGRLALEQTNLQAARASLERLANALQALRPPLFAAIAPEHMLAAIIEGSPYAKILVDRAGRIVLVNAQTEKLFGYSREALLGQSIDILVPGRFGLGHRDLRESFNAAPMARPMGAGRDLYGRRSDGSEVPIEIGLNPITSGGATFTLAAITDISERKNAEELRLLHFGVQQHAAKLEELNRELANASRFKTEFVATMSHELRTPLTAIIGAAELLNKAKLDERALLGVQTITEAAEALFSLINNVLDFSKIEAGKVELQTAPFNIEALLEGTAEVVAQLARDKGVTLYTYVDPTIPALQGDPDRLRQIVLNLLGNAVKFTEHGRVVARALILNRSSSEVVVRFEVEDTGIGIAPDVLPRLFEPFVQATSTARQAAGTGLGLSIARRLVELMGGEIGVISEVGAGSSFWFTARFLTAIEPPEAQRRLPDGVAGLIVTGDDTFADIVERYMASWAMKSRRLRNRDAVVDALRDTSGTWIAIVDLDDVGVANIGVTIDILRAILPARVIAIGKDGLLRKPIRQSYLFDAIVKAVASDRPDLDVTTRAPLAVAPHGSGTVLVAEDNAQLQRLLQLQFDDLGVPVVFVPDGQQAVDAALRDAYALIFMDCQMPVLDGLAATRAIREAERTRGGHIPITAMTANAFSEDRDACIAAGMDHYLAKPVRLTDLRSAIERLSRLGSS